MVTRPPSKRPTAARKGYVEQIESAEVRRSRKAAILQLKMGRLAHVIGIASGLALALTAVIAYGLVHWDFMRSIDFLPSLKWIIPLAAGLVVAMVGLAIKWDPYIADRGESHFITSIVAAVAPIFLIVLILLDELGYVDIGTPDWLYPASLLGISLTLISLAMTWEGTSNRRTISIVAAIFPIGLLVLPMVYRFPTDQLDSSILPMLYLGSAVAIQLSGSMLHIIASSTSIQQREVLRASDGKLKEQIMELDKKRRAILYREEAQRAKESELEAYERRLSDELASVDELKAQAAANEKEIETRLQSVREAREKLSKQEADVDAKIEEVRVRQGDIDAQKRDIERTVKAVAAKDASVAERERDVARMMLEAQTRERETKFKVSEVDGEAAALADMRKDLENQEKELVVRENDLVSGERALNLKALEATLAKERMAGPPEKVADFEKRILSMQESVSIKEQEVKALEDEVRRKSDKADRLMARADRQMNELAEKENALSVREKAVTDKESGVRDALAKFNSQLEEMTMARAAVTDREKQYQELTQTTKTKLSTLSAREDEISRKMNALEKREAKIKELEMRLKQEHGAMNSKLQELLEKEKGLSAQEAEIGLRQAELKAMELGMLETVDDVEEVRGEIPDENEREKVFALREQRLVEKEQDMKSRLYQREKELEKREKAMQAHLKKDIEEMEETVDEEYAEKKVKSGIERLDDLLLGGIPFGSNVLYVGPPFIGKETAMLLFVAEGLKKGVPAIIVTTSHSPAELAKEIAPILPTFMEFQQLGLVHWIDASGVESDPDFQANGNMKKVSGPADFDGIMSGIESSMKKIDADRHPYFRLAFISLSMSITQAEDKKGYLFVQSLVGRAKLAQAISVFAVDRGMHTEQQLESIQHLMSGAIQFKTERQKTLLSVQGITDAQTRAWVEYKHSNKALMIGAFSLERIR